MHEETKNARGAARKILKTSSFSRFSRLRHHGTGVIFTFSVRGRKGRYLVKTYPTKSHIETEAKNLRNTALAPIRAPMCFGVRSGYLVEEFAEGEVFQEILSRISPAERHRKYRAAIEELVRIHTAGNCLKDKRWLNSTRFGVSSFRKRLRTFQEVVAGEGFTSYEKCAGRVPRKWQIAVARIPVERLVRTLGVRGASYVVGHGDYKPNNIIFNKRDERPWIIDWLGMSKAQPWYDLAYLLVHEPAKDTFLSLYLKLLHERGFLRKVSGRGARKLFRDGMIFQEFQRAKSNATKIHARRDAHHIGEFRAALNGLSHLVLHSS